jgi:glycosyltransferase involved in cell wall biosynthesis
MSLPSTIVCRPLMTLYILNFNYGDYIIKAVESAIDQDFGDFELIIIDDGSSDGSREKIRPYEGLTNVTVIYQSNKGLTTSANVALHLARGKYFMRLDADDWLETCALTVMTREMERTPDAVYLFPDYWLADKQGNDYLEVSAVAGFPGKDPAAAPPHGACTLIRKDLLISCGGYDETIPKHDGSDLYKKLHPMGKALHVQERLFHYRRHGQNLSNEIPVMNKKENFCSL